MVPHSSSGTTSGSAERPHSGGSMWTGRPQDRRGTGTVGLPPPETQIPAEYADYHFDGDMYNRPSSLTEPQYTRNFGHPHAPAGHIMADTGVLSGQYRTHGITDAENLLDPTGLSMQRTVDSHLTAPPYSSGYPSVPHGQPTTPTESWQASPSPYQTSSSPLPPELAFSQAARPHPNKRLRTIHGETADSGEEEDVAWIGLTDSRMGSGDQNPIDKSKRACARCKGLKVRCQFKTDSETCERCLKGPYECVFPGRKLRRPPVKREVLLTKIREQAAQINDLMSQLEDSTRRVKQRVPSDALIGLSHTSLSSQESPPPSVEISSPASTGGDSHISLEHSEWISEARQTLKTFGNFLALGSASTSRSYFVEEPLENSESSEDEFTYADIAGPESEDESQQKRIADAPMASIPSGASPFGLMARVSAHVSGRRAVENAPESEKDVGVAHKNFFRTPEPETFRPSTDYDGHEAPLLLRESIITPREAEGLFNLYFTWMNPSLSLLDPILYTPQQVYWRSPFLFTVICATASRYDTGKPDLYQSAIAHARRAAAEAFITGPKTVEAVQAYILLSLYPVPARRWEDDRCYIFLGQAIRIAMDMNLNHPNTARPQNELHAREMLNRTRAWLNCFNLDRSTSSQYGKIAIIPSTDYVANHSAEWWRSSEFNLPLFDIHTCAYNNELRILGEFFVKYLYTNPNHPTGLNKDFNIEQVAAEYDDKIEATREQWFRLLEKTDQSDRVNRFRTGLLKLGYSYGRLVVLSHGFQNSFSRDKPSLSLLKRCLGAATDVIKAMIDDIGTPDQRKYVRMGPDAQTVFVAFSCTFLIKLLLPRYEQYITREHRQSIIQTVQRAIEFQGSPDISIDDQHGPRLYSRFIASLLQNVLSPRVMSPRPKKTAGDGPTSINPAQAANLEPPASQPRRSPLSAPNFTHLAARHAPFTVHTTFAPVQSDAFYAPLPNTSFTQFDHFAPATEASPYASGGLQAQSETVGMDGVSFFSSPLPFENDILSSMQSVASLSDDQAALPGFGWMGQMPPVNMGGVLSSYPQH